MKKLFNILTLSLIISSSVFAQKTNDTKKQLVDQVEEKHIWMTSYLIDNYFTINVDKPMWDALLGAVEFPYGHTNFNNMAQSLIDYTDAADYTSLNDKCGFTVQTDVVKSMKPMCKEQIDGLKGKLSFTMNAPGVAFNKKSYNMMLGYMSTVYEFFYARGGKIKNGWRTKTGKLNIVINVSDKNKVVSVSWSADGSTVTISGPATTEIAGWSDKITNGIAKGGK